MAFRRIVLAALLIGACAALDGPSASITGEPVYTVSNEGVRMLYVNPFDCKQPATSLATWIIEMDQPETIYSVQVSIVDNTLDDTEEDIVVRVGNNNPLEAGASSNSLCTLAEVNSTSSMLSYKCQEPVNGAFISITRNDAGAMNVCAFSANLGTITFPPLAPGPFVSVPAADLMEPGTPEQAATLQSQQPVADAPEQQTATQPKPTTALAPQEAAATAPEQAAATTPEVDAATAEPEQTSTPAPQTGLPTLTAIQSFLALSPVPAPGPGQVLAPEAADQPSTLPAFSAAAVTDSPVPAPGPAPVPGPGVAPVSDVNLPTFAAVESTAESSSPVEVPVPAPALAPVPAPQSAETSLPVFAAQNDGSPVPAPAPVPAPQSAETSLPVFAAQNDGSPAPAPVPAPALAPVPAPVEDASTSVFAAVQTPVPAPAPAPLAPAPTPTEEEAKPLISPSSPLLSSLEVPPAQAPRTSFATQDPPSDAAAAQNSNNSPHSGGGGLSGGAIAGIVIGCVVGVALIAAVALYATRHHDYSRGGMSHV